MKMITSRNYQKLVVLLPINCLFLSVEFVEGFFLMLSNRKQPGFGDRLKIHVILTWMDFGICKPRESKTESTPQAHTQEEPDRYFPSVSKLFPVPQPEFVIYWTTSTPWDLLLFS